jgi:hypothetical protein
MELIRTGCPPTYSEVTDVLGPYSLYYPLHGKLDPGRGGGRFQCTFIHSTQRVRVESREKSLPASCSFPVLVLTFVSCGVCSGADVVRLCRVVPPSRPRAPDPPPILVKRCKMRWMSVHRITCVSRARNAANGTQRGIVRLQYASKSIACVLYSILLLLILFL